MAINWAEDATYQLDGEPIGWSERHPLHGLAYRAEVGITEVALIADYARRPYGPAKLAEDLVALAWPQDQAEEFARIIARTCEIVWTEAESPFGDDHDSSNDEQAAMVTIGDFQAREAERAVRLRRIPGRG